MSFLSIQGLHKSYGSTSIFTDINCEIAKGEFITLLGPSGCGKSTLLRCIAGLTGVNGGQVLLDGEDLVPVAPQKARHRHGVPELRAVPQHDRAAERRLWPAHAEGQRQRGRAAGQRSAGTLVELNDFANRYPPQLLSGGQCQRVALARSLVTRPRLLLLDEPLSALDARIRKHLREQIRNIQQEMGLTTIFVTHDQEEALVMSDRIFLMNGGKIVQSGDAETLYTAPADAVCRRVYRQLQPARRRCRQPPAAAARSAAAWRFARRPFKSARRAASKGQVRSHQPAG